MTVDRELIEFAVRNMLMNKAISMGKYHDQDTLEEDLQKIVDDGKMPSGWYSLNKLVGLYECKWITS